MVDINFPLFLIYIEFTLDAKKLSKFSGYISKNLANALALS